MSCQECFSYGKIEEKVYVYQPPGLEDPDFPDKVYKVEKALYGLHQAPRACCSYDVCALEVSESSMGGARILLRTAKPYGKLKLALLQDVKMVEKVLMLLVYKLLLLVFRVNVAGIKLQLLTKLQLLMDKDWLKIKITYEIKSATRILNMVSTKKVDKTPYELWYEKVPNLSYLKVWGCEALVKRDTPDKLQQRSIMCIFIGYPKETMGYYFYFSPENKIVITRYVEFFKKKLISQEASWRTIELKEIQDEDTSPSENTRKIPMEVEGFEPPQEE
ncbi:retrotransposon protein, putative, ty1-copia subclass, partial [Tanacetum coccineum]